MSEIKGMCTVLLQEYIKLSEEEEKETDYLIANVEERVESSGVEEEIEEINGRLKENIETIKLIKEKKLLIEHVFGAPRVRGVETVSLLQQ